MKTCTSCRESKPLSDFCKRVKYKDGLNSICRLCSSQKSKEYRRLIQSLPDDDPKKQRYKQSHAEGWRRYKARHPDRVVEARRRRDRDKHLARKKVQWAVKKGTIVKPNACERCGLVTSKTKLEGHHTDYSKPLEVVWLCSQCHSLEHNPHVAKIREVA